MWTSKSVRCPVCDAILGRTVLNQATMYPCKECQWIFHFNSQGHPLKPEKLNPKKPNICDCEGCKYRDEQELLRRIKKL